MSVSGIAWLCAMPGDGGHLVCAHGIAIGGSLLLRRTARSPRAVWRLQGRYGESDLAFPGLRLRRRPESDEAMRQKSHCRILQ